MSRGRIGIRGRIRCGREDGTGAGYGLGCGSRNACNVLAEPGEDGHYLCAGCAALRIKLAAGAVDQSLCACPFHGCERIAADRTGICKSADLGRSCYGVAAESGIAVQNCRAERAVRIAADDLVFFRPCDCLLVVLPCRHVAKRAYAGNSRLAGKAVQDRHDHAAGRGGLWAERAAACSVHQAIFAYISDIIIKPVGRFHIRKRAVCRQC